MRKNLLASILALALFLTSCAGGTAATSIRLRKTEGTVGVSDGGGKEVPPRDDLGLYSGYGVDTQTESYAWIDLDDVKLTKLDQDSEIAITKEGKKLEIEVKAGSLFFNVTQPLADDESMNIRTSSMAVGIRGTCGWVTQDTAALLEGTVEVTAGDQSVTVSAGEMAVLTDGALEVVAFSNQDIPDFVREELEEDEALAELPGNDPDGPDEGGDTPPDPIWAIDYHPDGTPNARTEYSSSDPGTDNDIGYFWNDGAWELDGSYHAEYTEDSRGRLVEQTTYRDGVLHQHDVRIEDGEDYSVYQSTYYYDGEANKSTYTIYYDSQGREARYEYEIGSYDVSTYDDQGRMTRIDFYYDGALTGYVIYGYDGDSDPLPLHE